MAKPKKIAFELIDPNAEPMLEPYCLLAEVREENHFDTAKAKIALAWRKGLKPDPDGRLTLGFCMRATDLQRELVDWDFVIVLNREVWEEPLFTREKKVALLDHEMCHAARAFDKDGDPKVDNKGRPVWRMRGHTIEEFHEIVERHGLYKHDIESFARILLRKKNNPIFAEVEAAAD